MDELKPIPAQELTDLPKPELEESKKSGLNVWLRSLSSLALFIFIGYFFFQKNWNLVIVLTVVVVIHELGHFLAMKLYNYQELGIFFIPLLGAYASGKKQEISQTQSAVILLAGPLPGIVLGFGLHFIAVNTGIYFLEQIAWIFILLNMLNLLPVYPLDGGQLLHRLFLDDKNILSKIFVIISAGFMIWMAISTGFWLLLLFPYIMISRMIGDIRHERVISKLEAEGIDLNKTYEELSAEDYWRIRNLIINYYPQFRDINPSPPYEISPKEEQVVVTIQGLLQRTLVQDLPLTGKFIILVVWTGFFAAPFFIKNPFIYF